MSLLQRRASVWRSDKKVMGCIESVGAHGVWIRPDPGTGFEKYVYALFDELHLLP